MQHATIVRCGCRDGCDLWMALETRDREALGDRHLAVVHPSHLRSHHQIRSVSTRYAIVRRDRVA